MKKFKIWCDDLEIEKDAVLIEQIDIKTAIEKYVQQYNIARDWMICVRDCNTHKITEWTITDGYIKRVN